MNIGDFMQKFMSYPPKMSITFFHERFKIEKIMMCRMCANTVFFQNVAWDGHKCSGFQPFLNWIFPRGDTSIFSKKLASFYLQKWGGMEGFEIDQICGFCLKTDTNPTNKNIFTWPGNP